jgi:hypothetical protein
MITGKAITDITFDIEKSNKPTFYWIDVINHTFGPEEPNSRALINFDNIVVIRKTEDTHGKEFFYLLTNIGYITYNQIYISKETYTRILKSISIKELEN